jgi:tetratricopeptide (TPR) repeat protein
LKHHRAGQLAQAEACYRAMLEIDPRCAQAHHLLGLMAQQAGRHPEAIQLIGAALALDPDDPDILSNLAGSHLTLGEFQPAMEHYQRLVELRPDTARAHYCLGVAQEMLGRLDAALGSYRRAVALQPDAAEFHCGLARDLYKSGDLPAAVESYQRALTLDPNRWDIHNGLGLALTDLGRYETAAEVLHQGLALHPDDAKMYASLGCLYDCQGDLPAAADAYRRAIQFDPALVSPHCQLGLILFGLGKLAEAEACFQRVQTLDPNNADATFYLATLHLLQGQFATGWREYESRWQTAAGRRQRWTFSQPQWQGEPLNGERILIYAEQGFGDTLNFVRYVPLVAARGGQVILEVQPQLRRLLASTEGAWQVLGRGDALPDFAWQCPLMSLPLVFGTDWNTIPAQVPPVQPPPILVEKWRQRLAGETVRIGITFSGSPDNGHNRWRSLPLAQLAPLTNLEGTTFYSLQKGGAAEQIKQLNPPARLIDLQDELQDFADTAAIIAHLNLVITIDTSVAHLAGAMGKPVWILLHNASDWRWFLNRDDSPWYPTAWLFRQATHGNWQEVIIRVEMELRKLLAAHAVKQ